MSKAVIGNSGVDINEEEIVRIARVNGVIVDDIPSVHSDLVHNDNIIRLGVCPLCDKGSIPIHHNILENIKYE